MDGVLIVGNMSINNKICITLTFISLADNMYLSIVRHL